MTKQVPKMSEVRRTPNELFSSQAIKFLNTALMEESIVCVCVFMLKSSVSQFLPAKGVGVLPIVQFCIFPSTFLHNIPQSE